MEVAGDDQHRSAREDKQHRQHKRAPPVLRVAACGLLGGPRAAALPAAAALEMLHVASLVHDDPLLRRGRPSMHVAYGTGMAALAGDALGAVGSTGVLAGATALGEAEVMQVLTKKLGEMAECSAACGAMLGGFALRCYGRTIGVLYCTNE